MSSTVRRTRAAGSEQDGGARASEASATDYAAGSGDDDVKGGTFKVDYSKPILPQVPKLGEAYEEWVHKPSAQPHFRMFESDFFEWFATMNWYMVPIIWIPVSLAFAHLSLTEGGDGSTMSGGPDATGHMGLNDTHAQGVSTDGYKPLTQGQFAGWWVVGLGFWTISEYGLHRFVFHGPILSNGEFFLRFHFLMHGQHHKFPLDKGRLVFPLVPALITGSILYAILYALLPLAASFAAMSGLLIGYIMYDLTHYYVHHGKPESGYFRRLREHHMQHHFRNQDSGFGITSTLWDYVFSSGHGA
eukprot:m.36686 g.36686  ORF g.36686 m.36686 type:complete len:302 (+) comp5433_c0_seq1:154-1059(+)